MNVIRSKKVFFVLLNMMLATELFSQTCVIIHCNEHEIIVGTESRISQARFYFTDNKFTLQRSVVHDSNIQKAGNFYYSFAGTNFGVDSILRKTAVENEGFDIWVQLSRNRIRQYLEKLLEPVRAAEPELLRKEFHEKEFVQVFCYCFEKKKPRVIALWFELPLNMGYPLTINSGFKEISNNHVAIGPHDAFENEFDETAQWQKDPAENIRRLLQKQMAKSGEDINAEIQLKTLTK